MNLEGIPFSDIHGSFWIGAAAALISSAITWLFLRYLDRS
jgi:zinc transporter